ncbi:ATP-binding cassette subfamily B protein [Croceifilum oryzae]|uniref:ATP-binding cassette subfamily B protein n=1 Tax=Croceifilum oryzae TaxID=1553429 RepID=A0AAJ1THF3_9BACL|nr:lasso peptide biosynthesis B2 protein [Croceifilum oryzae]MDQ0416597.1 ATP-binding cassette subfamily B protein [Croceifilum oryzae]
MIRGWICLVIAIFLIRTRSVEQLKPFLRKRKDKCKEICSLDEVEQAFVKIEQAKRLFLSRTACLEESLALFLYVTSKRKSVDWLIGVRLAPFASHAWIEVDGQRTDGEAETYKKILVI